MNTLRIVLLGAGLALAGCPSGDDDPASDVTLPLPESGFQLTTGVMQVPAASEIQDCYYFRVPETTYVNRFEISQNQGTHHMNTFRVSTPDSPYDDGDVQRGCWDSLPFQDWGLLLNSQISGNEAEDGVEWQLPEGIAVKLDEGELVMIQSHYVNGETQATANGRGKVVLNYHGIPESEVTAEVGSMFANNRNLFLRSGEQASYTSVCRVPEEIHLLAVSGHFHSRGRNFTVDVADDQGDPVENIYESPNWDDPPFKTFGDDSVVVPAGGGLSYTCSFENDQPYDIVFGPHVEFEEHCNLFAFYYPRFTEQGSLYCF
jgi:hypothetical protein